MLTPEMREVLTPLDIECYKQCAIALATGEDDPPSPMATMGFIEDLARSRLESKRLHERLEHAIKAAELYRWQLTGCVRPTDVEWSKIEEADRLHLLARKED